MNILDKFLKNIVNVHSSNTSVTNCPILTPLLKCSGFQKTWKGEYAKLYHVNEPPHTILTNQSRDATLAKH